MAKQVFARAIADDLRVEGTVGYGPAVTLRVSPGDMKFEFSMDPDVARELGVALMDAAAAADQAEAEEGAS